MKFRTYLVAIAVVFLMGGSSVHAATPSIQVSDVSRTVVMGQGGKAPTCKTTFTYKKPRAGEMTTLLWRSQKAEYMTGLYTKERRPARGSQNIVFGHSGEQTFTLSFTGSGGTTTCTARIMVREKLEESV